MRSGKTGGDASRAHRGNKVPVARPLMTRPETSGQTALRHLVLVLGDQLDGTAAAFDDCDPAQDAIWMAEVQEESTHVWSSQARIALFLGAMRHFASERREQGWTVHYRRLEETAADATLAGELLRAIERLRPRTVRLTAPGDHRVLKSLRATAARAAVPIEICADRHFYVSVQEFAAHARGRRQLRLEYFYREQRRRHDVLMENGEPAGGRWNFDEDNRQSFPPSGPGAVPAAPRFDPDPTTSEVLALVRSRFAGHPGRLAGFGWAVTRAQARAALQSFVRERLAEFGRWQDALWPNESGLWHSQLSASLNLKLLHPREVVAAAEEAWQSGAVPLASAEGFIRQILGWREYVRGIYWTRMPEYAESNALAAHADLPRFYWTGEAPMPCLADALRQTLANGYAHHIQRLMVIGLYALLLGVEPRQVHAWFLAVYVDAVEWVELPNVIGMSQFADGGVMASKPYIASGQYIRRMCSGAYCAQCRFDPAVRAGPKACPYTLLYWDFLLRHETMLAANPRTALQARNVARLSETERETIVRQAGLWRRANS